MEKPENLQMKLTTVPLNDSKRKGYELYTDGEYAFFIDEETYIRLSLYDKTEITAEELEEIKTATEVNRGISYGIDYVSRVKRTRKQVFEYLQKMGLSQESAEKILDHLCKEKYIDDEDYAKRYIKTGIKTGDKSVLLLLNELKQRGISEETAEKASKPYLSMEADRAYAAVRKRFDNKKQVLTESLDEDEPFSSFEKLTPLDKLKMKEKIYRFLAYRGYSYETITDVIEKTGL
jgi:regulatory protein